MTRSVIVGGARTPTGRLLGSLTSFSAPALGGIAAKEALRRAGLAGEQVDYVICGQVLQAGAGQAPARQAAVTAGIPLTTPSITINKVCLSGLTAIAMADQLIRAGEVEIVLAGGMESMTNAPHLLPKARSGYKYGSVEVLDAMARDGLVDAFDDCSMGELTERHIAPLGISRQAQDEFAARSHQRATLAQKNGALDEEIVPVQVPQKRGEPILFHVDEGVRPDTDVETLARLKPSFSADGTITAGSASQISDGAAAVVVMSAELASALGLEVLAEIHSYASVAGPDNSLHSQPSNAIRAALSKEGLGVDNLDLIEINEAFAAVVLQSIRDLGLSETEADDKVNVDGGAIAIGHPVGASGARLVLHLAHALRRRGGGTGVAALCGGGGQGDALMLTVEG